MKKLLVIILAALLVIGCVPATAAGSNPTGYKLDEMVTTDLNGNEVTGEIFSQYKLTYLNLWATWCGPCLSELPHIQEMHENEEFAERGLNVMGLLWEDSSSTVKSAKKTLGQYNCTYTNIRIGNDQQLIDLVNNSGDGIPVSYLLNSEGEVIKFTVGSMSKAQMKNFINQGFAMVETEPTPTPVSGIIEKAEIKDVKTAPVTGDKAANYLTYTVAEDAPFTVEDIMWGDLEAEQKLEPDYVFEAGKTYQLAILLSAKTGYIFTDETVISVNGGMELSEESGMDEDGASYWVLTLPTEATEPVGNAVGDINGDGNINTGDAVLVLKAAAEMITFDENEKIAADTNFDGNANTADAVLILKYAAGMITEFGQTEPEPEPPYMLIFNSWEEISAFYMAGQLSDEEFEKYIRENGYDMNGITSREAYSEVLSEIQSAPFPYVNELTFKCMTFYIARHEMNIMYAGENDEGYSFTVMTDSDTKLDEHMEKIRNDEKYEKVEINSQFISEAYYLTENEYDMEAYYVVISDYCVLYRAARCSAESARTMLENVDLMILTPPQGI